ncbi:hypothetical protein BS50DRAFT_584313 [Corynespora cassiicola Philippines]|uniref:Uncharacterized protein n=1 Tax=Corynespora cassiicola Philippines TaxID=1448308 RepID=A0A2T2NZ73_CORCC|nr:hypothetical protein BS50DRAFT_584313 [Corynespora cassiicola Philippines]
MNKRSVPASKSKRTRIINDEGAAGAAGIDESEPFTTERQGTRIINDKLSSPKDKIKRTRIINDGFMDDGEPFTSDREGTRIINDGSSGPMDKSKRTRIINDGSMGDGEPFTTESQGTRIINDEASKRDAEPYYPGAELIAPHHTECEPGEGMCDKYNYTAFTCGDDGEWDVYMKCNEYSCRIDSQGQSFCRHGGTSPPGLITKSQSATTPPTAAALAF